MMMILLIHKIQSVINVKSVRDIQNFTHVKTSAATLETMLNMKKSKEVYLLENLMKNAKELRTKNVRNTLKNQIPINGFVPDVNES